MRSNISVGQSSVSRGGGGGGGKSSVTLRCLPGFVGNLSKSLDSSVLLMLMVLCSAFSLLSKYITYTLDLVIPTKCTFWDLPGGPVAQTPCSQFRGHRFNP